MKENMQKACKDYQHVAGDIRQEDINYVNQFTERPEGQFIKRKRRIIKGIGRSWMG